MFYIIYVVLKKLEIKTKIQNNKCCCFFQCMVLSFWLRISKQVFPVSCLLFVVLSNNVFNMDALYSLTVISLSINLNACVGARASISGSNYLMPLSLKSKHWTGFAIQIPVFVPISACQMIIMHYCTAQKCWWFSLLKAITVDERISLTATKHLM